MKSILILLSALVLASAGIVIWALCAVSQLCYEYYEEEILPRLEKENELKKGTAKQ